MLRRVCRLVTRRSFGAWLLCVVAACQGNHSAGDDSKNAGTGSGSALAIVDAAVMPVPDAADEPATANELEAGTIAAWDAVVWRNRYLARRGQHGVIVGRVGAKFVPPAVPVAPGPAAPAGSAGFGSGVTAPGSGAGSGSGAAVAPPPPPRTPSDLIWLIDDSAGHGSLGVRVQFASAPPVAGERVALGGAWMLDSAKQWYWKVDSVTLLPGIPASDIKEAPSAPGLIVTAGPAPSGARMASLARDNDAIYFQVVGMPKHPGDGWKIADELGNPPVGILMLPGEQPSYGSIDLRTPDERWVLRRGVTYWLRIGRLRKSNTPGSPWSATARTAPVREM